MDRRHFIKASLASSGGLLLCGYLPSVTAQQTELSSKHTTLTPLIDVATDGTITIYVHKQEMGQGIATGIAMITAEELCADWQDITVEPVKFDKNLEDIANEYGRLDTGGSYSMRAEWDLMRTVGATAKQLLCLAAASVWKTDVNHCAAKDSKVLNTNTGQSLSYASLAPLTKGMAAPTDVAFKDQTEYRIIGKPTPSLKTKTITQATHTYSIDVVVPNMLHALIIRPPVWGTEVKSFDSTEAEKINGIVNICELSPTTRDKVFCYGLRGGIAIVGDTCWACLQARELVSVSWTTNQNNNRNDLGIYDELDRLEPDDWTIQMQSAPSDPAFTDLGMEYSAEYTSPYIAHQLMEPLNAIAQTKQNGDIEVWTGTQSPNHTASNIAETYGIKKEQITVHPYPMGGGYGRRYFSDFVIETIAIAKHMNRPVKLIWTREDEVQFGSYHPLRKDYLSAKLDNQGNILEFKTKCASTHRWSGGELLFPYGHQGAEISNYYYNNTLVNTGPWRAVVAHLDTFSREIFIDELAVKAEQDPLTYRLNQLKRSIPILYQKPEKNTIPTDLTFLQSISTEVLNELAELSGWYKNKQANIGFGIAMSAYHSSSICAQVVEVELSNNQLKINKVYCVGDVGLAVNPDSVKAQIEGSILWGLTPVLHGGITVKNGCVEQSNFHDASIARMSDAPEIIIKLINVNDRPPQGVGEFAVPPTAPAIHNAYFNLTGKRTRDMNIKT